MYLEGRKGLKAGEGVRKGEGVKPDLKLPYHSKNSEGKQKGKAKEREKKYNLNYFLLLSNFLVGGKFSLSSRQFMKRV